MKLKNKIQGGLLLLGLSLFTYSCSNPDTTIKNDFEDAKEELDKEFSKEMIQKGNDEISIDDIEKDLGEMDAELEEIMQEMENEMNIDSNYNSPDTING